MATKAWSTEEREKAAQQISEREGIPWAPESILDVEHGSDRPMWTPLTRACLDLQCELNEARELLSDSLGQSGSYIERRKWQERKYDWLSRNK